MTTKKRSTDERKTSRRKSDTDLKKRLDRAEEMIDLVLSASLRGRLLTADRRVVQRSLDARHEEVAAAKKKRKKMAGPRCPACMGPLANPAAERCPHCLIILDVVAKD